MIFAKARVFNQNQTKTVRNGLIHRSYYTISESESQGEDGIFSVPAFFASLEGRCLRPDRSVRRSFVGIWVTATEKSEFLRWWRPK